MTLHRVDQCFKIVRWIRAIQTLQLQLKQLQTWQHGDLPQLNSPKGIRPGHDQGRTGKSLRGLWTDMEPKCSLGLNLKLLRNVGGFHQHVWILKDFQWFRHGHLFGMTIRDLLKSHWPRDPSWNSYPIWSNLFRNWSKVAGRQVVTSDGKLWVKSHRFQILRWCIQAEDGSPTTCLGRMQLLKRQLEEQICASRQEIMEAETATWATKGDNIMGNGKRRTLKIT